MKRWTRVILGTLMAVMCAVSAVLPAFAADNPTVSIPVTVSLSGTMPKEKEKFTVVLQADDDDYPMPAGSEDGVCTMTITGADTKNFPTITYKEVGVYTYTVSQKAGSSKKCTYDETKYALTVTISNTVDGDGLQSAAVLYPDTEGDKQSVAEFENAYEADPTATPTPTAAPVPDKTTTTASPKTGDESTPGLYAVLLAASVGAIVIVRRKRAR